MKDAPRATLINVFVYLVTTGFIGYCGNVVFQTIIKNERMDSAQQQEKEALAHRLDEMNARMMSIETTLRERK